MTDPTVMQEMQGSPENYKGMYAGLKFPRFVHQEYPKIIYADEERRKIAGTAQNAKEEKEIYDRLGIEKEDLDPMGAAMDEIAQLRAKLAQYEGSDPAKQLAAKVNAPKTNTVQPLSASAPQAAQGPAPAEAKPNPLMQKGSPLPVGSAPKIDAPMKPGV